MYERDVWYHVYPLGFLGAELENSAPQALDVDLFVQVLVVEQHALLDLRPGPGVRVDSRSPSACSRDAIASSGRPCHIWCCATLE
jgi:hypothetical protein